MPIELQTSDGTTLRFPDGTPQEIIERTIQSLEGRAPRTPPTAAQAQPNLPSLNLGREAGFGQRAGAGLKITPEGRAGFLEETTGLQVITDPEGKEFLFDPESNEVFPVDRAAFNLRDIADVSGPALESGISIAGGTNPLAVAGATAAGEGVRQGISELLPGEESLSLGERAGRVAGAAAIGGAAQGVINIGGRVFDLARPSNIAARVAARQAARPTAAEARRLERATGINFSFGERTGSRGALLIEGVLRRHPVTADRVGDLDAEKLLRLVRLYDRQLDRIAAGGGDELAGQRVRTAFTGSVETAVKIRRDRAKIDFPAVDAASNGAQIIPPSNTLQAVDQLIERFSVPGGGDATATLVSRLREVREQIAGFVGEPLGQTRQIRNLSASETQRLLEIYGNASQGTGQIFKDIDRAQQRLIAGDIFAALQRDLDDAVDSGNVAGTAAELLRTARDNYRINSEPITSLRDSALGRIFGTEIGMQGAPEIIAQKLRGMKPSDVRASFDIINRASPETAQIVKRNMLEDVLENSFEGLRRRPSPDAPATSASVSPPKLLNNLRSSPVWSVMNRAERIRAVNIFRTVERFGQRLGEGSPTAPLQWGLEIVKALGRSAAGLNPVTIAETIGAVLAPRRAAALFFDPAGQEALVTISRLSDPPRKILGALTTLAGLIAAEETPENVRPDTQGALP